MTDDQLILPEEIPAPLEIYEQERIHPSNQALLDERLERFRPLTRKEQRRLIKRRNQLWKVLNKGNYNFLVSRRWELWERANELREQIRTLTAERAESDKENGFDHEVHARINKTISRLRDEGRDLVERGNNLNRQLAPLEQAHDEYTDILLRLEDNEEMLAEEREREAQNKKYHAEGRIIEQLMLDTFARTRGCHHVWIDGRGRQHNDTPRFQRSGVSPDSHWFLLAASEKTRWGWRSILPYLVDVADLCSERTLENLSAALHRQVEVRRSQDGTQIYYHVNRLDSPDGLPRYFVFRAMFELYPREEHDLIPFPVGVYENRRVKWLNLKSDPHILIAGKTRAGKSNYVNTLISTWIQMHSPQELQLVLIDNKRGVEFTHYEGVPHLLGEFVQNLDDVLPKLEEVIGLMNHRLGLLRIAKKKEIFAYNASASLEDRIPHLVVVIDEMQTLLNKGQWTRDVHHALSVIGSQGAAAGVHLVLCTQHPSKEVVPMPVKTNMACFIMFRMGMHTSQTLISSTAAAELPRGIPGRTVVASGLDIERAQTAYIADEVVAEAVAYAIKRWSKIIPFVPMIEAGEDDEVTAVPVFTEEDLIAIAMENFGGALKARPIFDSLKHQNLVSQHKLVEMVKALIEKKEIDYLGKHYRFVKQFGNFYKLEEISSVTQVIDENLPHHETEQPHEQLELEEQEKDIEVA